MARSKVTQKQKQVEQALRSIHHAHQVVLEKQLDRTGVYRAQHMFLMFLSEHEGCSQKAIADNFNVSPATVGISLKKLEASGYLVREIDQSDNRYHKVTLTEEGRRVIRESRRVFDAVMISMFDGFSDEELDLLDDLLGRVSSNLSQISD